MKRRSLGLIGIVLTALALPSSAFGQTLANGGFATGDLTGWTANTVDSGQATLVKQGTSFSANPGSDQIPFPKGPGSYAVALRASDSPQSAGILTSDPFVPRSGKLAFYTLSENAAVAPKFYLLTPGADPLSPSISDVLDIQNVVHSPAGTGPTAAFQRQEVDVSSVFAASQAVRVQFRQPATASGAGYFTLIAFVDDSGQSPDIVPPAAVGDLNVSSATPFGVTLAFTAPKDTGFESTGNAASYDVRYGLAPLTEANFDAAPRFTDPPTPSPADAPESFGVTGLEPIQRYYFAVKALDAAGNRSPISNVPDAVTTAPKPGDPGITAEYFAIPDGSSLPPNRATLFTPARLIEGATRIEPSIDIDYESGRPRAVPHDQFGVRYTGWIVPKFTEAYTFCTESDDGTRLWIGPDPIDPDTATPVVSQWSQHGLTESCAAQTLALTAGTKYRLIEEYEQGDGGAANRLLWSSASQPKEVVPTSSLLSSELPVPAIGRVTGSVLDETAAPVPGFTLRLTPATDDGLSLTTDDSGVYTALLPAGTYTVSGGDLTHAVPASTPPITVTAGALTAAPPIVLGPPEPRSLGIVNGDFATGDFTGWTPTGYDGGLVQLEQNGKEYFGPPVPNPLGGKSWAVDVRSWDDPLHLGDTASTGILVSDPFIPNAPALSFWTHSQNKPVAAQLLLLKPGADPIQPKAEDILLFTAVRNDFPGMGSEASFEKQVVDISEFYNASDPTKGTPMRLEVRQHTLENGFGWYTLFADFDAGPPAPLPLLKGDLNFDGQVNVGDAIIGLQIVVGIVNPVPPVLVQLGDVAPKKDDGSFGDGAISVEDVVRILRRVVGLEADPWP